MIDAMRSLINTSIDTYRAPQLKLEELQRSPKPEPLKEKTYAPNPAVEITLSPQAQALLKAMEANQASAEQNTKDTTTEQQTNPAANDSQQEPDDTARTDATEDTIILPDNSVAATPAEKLEELFEAYGLPVLAEDDQKNFDLLFREIQISLQGNDSPAGIAPVARQEGTLSATEQMKVAALYAELDRLLGGTGVFFGGDQNIQRITTESQVRAREMKADLSNILGTVGSIAVPQGLTAPQEARVDAILREVAQLYARAQDHNAETREQAIQKALIGGSIAQAGGASLGG